MADLRRHDSPLYPRQRCELVGDRDPSRGTAGDLVALTLVGVAVTTGDLRALETIARMRHHREHLRTRCSGLRPTA